MNINNTCINPETILWQNSICFSEFPMYDNNTFCAYHYITSHGEVIQSFVEPCEFFESGFDYDSWIRKRKEEEDRQFRIEVFKYSFTGGFSAIKTAYFVKKAFDCVNGNLIACSIRGADFISTNLFDIIFQKKSYSDKALLTIAEGLSEGSMLSLAYGLSSCKQKNWKQCTIGLAGAASSFALSQLPKLLVIQNMLQAQGLL